MSKITQVNKRIIGFICFALAAFVLYTAVFGVLTAVVQRAIVLGVVLVVTCLQLINKSLEKNERVTAAAVVYALCAAVTVIFTIYIVATFKITVERAGRYTMEDVVIAVAVILVLLFAALKSLGLPMVIISVIFLLYTLFGQMIPGSFGHKNYSIARISTYLSLGTEGIFGTSMSVAAGVIITYSVFGCVMERFGLGDYFIKVAYGMVGRMKGGSAKASIVASALMGTVSGSAVANILTTGNFTLPLMYKSGYSKKTAAAILAVAATGGLIMPPVMGAAAFVMAEMRGVGYGSICIAAIVPAVLYFVSLFIQSGLEADRIGMKVLTKEELPKKEEWVKELYLFLPLIVLLVLLMVFQMPAQRAAVIAIAIILVLSFRKKEFWPTPDKLYEAISNGGLSVISTVLTCATAGIIVGCLSMSGLSVKISSLIMALSGSSIYLSLFLTMIVALILGMGMPPVASYIILASMVVPSLVSMGVPQMSADLFVFYFSCIGNITPPVALAAFTAAGLVKEDPFRTGWLALRYGIVTFLVPFGFCMSPSLLLQGNPVSVIYTVATALVGIWIAAIAIIGWWKCKVNRLFRILLFISGCTLLLPGIMTDAVGGIIAVIILMALFRQQKVKSTV